jgi:tetratricopeptide (TPR) repeat protein
MKCFAYVTWTMTKGVKSIKHTDPEELQSGKRAKSVRVQGKIKELKPFVLETLIYVFVILFLGVGTYWRNNIWNSDVDLWTDCVKKSPHKDRAHYGLGFALMSQGKYDEAIPHFNEALRINPNYAVAHNSLGTVFLNQGKYQEASDQYKEALRIYPDYAEARNNLGTVFLNQGKYQDATDQYKEALRIKPDNAIARINLGIAYLGIGDRNQALKEYEILKTMNPDSANALYEKINETK